MNRVEEKTAVPELRHEALARDIREQIRLGQLVPGDRLPSFNELRERWGAGQDTIERMYDSLERDGLVVRERRRGVFVSVPKPKTVGTIGFVNSPATHEHPYYHQLLSGVLEEARLARIEVLMLFLEETPARWQKVDGILYPATMHGDLQEPPGMPGVALIFEQHNASSVVADDYVGFREAMEHLWVLGHRRIAMLTAELQAHALSRRRLDAYRDVYMDKGVKLSPQSVRMLTNPGIDALCNEDQGYLDMRRWLREDWDELGCTAIMANNDEVATGVIRALNEAGYSVPGDVSVVGFDGTEIARYHRPRLTTVRTPLREIGALGLRMLTEQISLPSHPLEERQPIRAVLPTRLQIGDSTAKPKTSITKGVLK